MTVVPFPGGTSRDKETAMKRIGEAVPEVRAERMQVQSQSRSAPAFRGGSKQKQLQMHLLSLDAQALAEALYDEAMRNPGRFRSSARKLIINANRWGVTAARERVLREIVTEAYDEGETTIGVVA